MTNFKISGGRVVHDNGLLAGNIYNKYGSKNFIINYLMSGFEKTLSKFVKFVNPQSIHEIGCGEGYWVLKWIELNIDARGSDVSSLIVNYAKENAKNALLDKSIFFCKNIYDMSIEDSADLIVCCEVLEHLEFPDRAMLVLQKIVKKYLIISIPREPLWCFLNCLRGKYLKSFGNTPGHINHYTTRSGKKFLSKYFKIEKINKPIPWSMFLCSPK